MNNKLIAIGGLTQNLLIPEQTRSLLWVTNEAYDMSKTQTYDMGTGLVSYNSTGDIYSEPSLIWTRLPVVPNNLPLPEDPYYHPTYIGLTAEQRFQYLSWLRDISQPTYKSYVFLYYYGLERHLILGDFESAFKEILVILQNHDISSYIYSSLARASLYRHKNILDILPEIEGQQEVALFIRYHNKMSLTPSIVVHYARQSGFTNDRYIKLHPEQFRLELQKGIDKLEQRLGGSFFSKLEFAEKIEGAGMLNTSLSHLVSYDIPLTEDEKFEQVVYELMEKAHNRVRLDLHPNATIVKSNKEIHNSAKKKADYNQIQDAIKLTSSKYSPSTDIIKDKTDSMSVKQFNAALEKLDRVNILLSLNPDQAVDTAQELLESGYRTPAAYQALASACIAKNDYKSAVDTLMQASADYGYNFSSQLGGIVGRFKSELTAENKVSSRTIMLNNLIDDLIARTEKSPWAGEDKSVELSRQDRERLNDKVTKIWHLGKTDPDKSLVMAFKLFDDGYRDQFICHCISAAYRRKGEYKNEVNFLVQVKKDFPYYGFEDSLRQALRLLEKSGDSMINKIG